MDTRPYEALRFGTLAQPILILPQGDRKFSILHSQFSRRTAARVWPPYADPWPLVPDPWPLAALRRRDGSFTWKNF